MAGSFAPLTSFGGDVRPRLARLVNRQDLVAQRVAQTIEEAPATERVTPAFGENALRIGTEIKKIRPFLIGDGARIGGPRGIGFAAVRVFAPRARHAALWAL